MGTLNSGDPPFHQDCPIQTEGDILGQAKAAMLMLHGRGASANDILSLAGSFKQPGFCFVAPQAKNNAWYPNPFSAPIESNEPWLSSALSRINEIINQIINSGISLDRIYLLGFSQGACLALEYSYRNPKQYGGVIGLSGALIGPDDHKRVSTGSLKNTPVFLGCSDVDKYVPKKRVSETARVLEEIGGQVTLRLYAGMDHMVNQDEIKIIQEMVRG